MSAALERRTAETGAGLRGWWILGCMMVVILVARDLLHSHGGAIAGSVHWGRDFVNVWSGGMLVRQGRFDTLFDLAAYLQFQRSVFGDIGQHIYSYPPATYPIAAFFSLFPYPVALAGWTVATALLFVFAVRPWWPEKVGPVWLAILTPAALLNFWAGQYGLLAGSLFLLGWRNLDEHPRRAGIFFGLMLIKPHLALLVPIALLARRQWAAIASAAVTVAALFAVTSLCFGWQTWVEYVVRGTAIHTSLIDQHESFAGLMSTSFATATLHYVESWPFALTVQAAASTAAIVAVVLAARRSSTRDFAMLVATATFVALPYAFSYDLTVVCIGALLMLTQPDLTPGQRRLAMYGFAAPQLGMLAACFGLFLMPVMLAGLAFAQFRSIMLFAPAAPGCAPPPPRLHSHGSAPRSQPYSRA